MKTSNIFSLIASFTLVALDFLTCGPWSGNPVSGAVFASLVSCDLMSGAIIAAISPGSMKTGRKTYRAGLAAVGFLSLLSTLAQWFPPHTAFRYKLLLLPLALILCVAVLMVRLLGGVYAKVIHMFSNEEVWNGAMRLSAVIWLLLLSTVPMIYASGMMMSLPSLCFASLVPAAGLFVVFQLRAARSLTLMFPVRREAEIKAIVRGSLRSGTLEGGVEDRRMRSVYKKVTLFMAEKKPYLDSDVDLAYFSHALYTNKVYLSRAINVFSGRNFRQYLNYHRVEHSIELMKKDPRLTVEELASMSGFSSSVSYNMAFRMFKGTTPKEWLDNYRDSLRP